MSKRPQRKGRALNRPAELPPADDSVRREWLRRVEAEYRSGAHTQHLTLWLMQLGAPPDLIELGLRIVSDELKHAELSDAVLRAAGSEATPHLARETLELKRTAPELEFDVLRVGVEMFCLGETVAVRLFSRLRDGTSVPVARRALDEILRDEVRHREFGWTLLTWLMDTPLAPRFTQLLAHELPAMLERVRRNYGGVALDRLGAEALAAQAQALAPAARAWGLMPLAEYVAAVEETFTRDYAPRFQALGIALPEPRGLTSQSAS